MKRIITSLLIIAVVMNMSFMAFAMGIHNQEIGENRPFETEIIYEGIQSEYTISVPSEIRVGETKEVGISGYWPTDMVVNISVPKKVELVSTSNEADKIELGITFNNISVMGKGSSLVSETSSLTVENVSDKVFGTYKGYIVYDASLNEVTNISMTKEEADDLGFVFQDIDGGKELIKFLNNKSLTEIVVPAYVEEDMVVSIGNNVFKDMNTLTNITLPKTLVSIGNSAFANCGNLSFINIPNTVTFIDDSAFYNCTSLTSITIPGSVATIEDGLCEGCSGLTSVIMEEGITAIRTRAFQDCTSLKYVSIPDGVLTMGTNVFYNDKNIVSITLPNSITWINSRAFMNCTSAIIYVPESVRDNATIKDEAFKNVGAVVYISG